MLLPFLISDKAPPHSGQSEAGGVAWGRGPGACQSFVVHAAVTCALALTCDVELQERDTAELRGI